jgi:signal transduction histidine kinase
MTTSPRYVSIKSLFLWVVMVIPILVLLVALIISSLNQVKNYKRELVKDADTYAALISRNAAHYILEDNIISSEQMLETLAVVSFVQNVHVYKLNDNEELEFFASYNETGQVSIPAMFDRVGELSTVKFNGGFLEIIKPIQTDGKLVGYTYLRTSERNLNQIIYNSITVTLVVLFVTGLVFLLLTLRLRSSVSQPLVELTSLIKRIGRQSDYTERTATSYITELDDLSFALNGMLDHFQENMAKQREAEEEHKRLHASLEEKVNQRTAALKEANQELIQTLEKLHQFQRQMVQNEKMASLGDMVAGVAHEVNTPIGLGVTASTMMLDRLNDLQKEFEGKTLKASTLTKFIAEGQENLNIIYRNLERAADLISSFKQVAVDQSSENSRVFGFCQLMDEILLSMRPKLKKYSHIINLHCDKDLYIESKAGPINQIMINLIMNSILHGFEFMEQGQIDIYIEMQGEKKINICYKDNGKGIPENLRKRIFDPFVTTKRGQGGSGLGMHLVYNLVTQALNGSISINSEEGEGVEFQIMFPARKVSENEVSRR